MVNFCAVKGCSNRADREKDKKYYRLPTVITHLGPITKALTRRRRDLWLSRIKRADLKVENYKYTRICSDHFIGGAPSKLHDSTHPDWAPSRKLGYTKAGSNESRNEKECMAAMARYERAVERAAMKRKIKVASDGHDSSQAGDTAGNSSGNIARNSEENKNGGSHQTTASSSTRDVGTQT